MLCLVLKGIPYWSTRAQSRASYSLRHQVGKAEPKMLGVDAVWCGGVGCTAKAQEFYSGTTALPTQHIPELQSVPANTTSSPLFALPVSVYSRNPTSRRQKLRAVNFANIQCPLPGNPNNYDPVAKPRSMIYARYQLLPVS